MTATLRHDITTDLANALEGQSPGLLKCLEAKEANRWQGAYRSARVVVTFAIKLPEQIHLAMTLLRELDEWTKPWVGSDHRFVLNRIAKQAQALFDKIWKSLGLELNPWLPGYDVATLKRAERQEWAFLGAIGESSSDLASWGAYADFLQEQPDRATQRRGQLIAGWLGPKPIKVKYGIPELARAESESP